MKKGGGIKRDALDRWFSYYIRARAGWRCERCGKQPSKYGLHCSHFIGRAAKGVRWDPANAAALCYGCHRYMESNPQLHEDWFKHRLGEDRFWALRARASRPTRFTAADKAILLEEVKKWVRDLDDSSGSR